MRNALLTSDLHLTTKPIDSYRWELFPWLAEEAKRRRVRRLFVLGDLTDAKDHHPSLLVNQVVQAACGVIEHAGLEELVVLRGNHDGVDPEWPYFRFLNELPRVAFIFEPDLCDFGGECAVMLPHSRRPEEDWRAMRDTKAPDAFMHATVQGAEAEGGQRLLGDGLSTRFVRSFAAKKIWSGDVHVPQRCGPVEYVGSPYPVRFGDSFRPRVVYLNDRGVPEDLYPPTIRRLMLDVTDPSDLNRVRTAAGDQAKVRVRLERSQYGLWHDHKAAVQRWAERKRVELASVELVPSQSAQEVATRVTKATAKRDPRQLFLDYCAAADVSDELRESGKELLD